MKRALVAAETARDDARVALEAETRKLLEKHEKDVASALEEAGESAEREKQRAIEGLLAEAAKTAAAHESALAAFEKAADESRKRADDAERRVAELEEEARRRAAADAELVEKKKRKAEEARSRPQQSVARLPPKAPRQIALTAAPAGVFPQFPTSAARQSPVVRGAAFGAFAGRRAKALSFVFPRVAFIRERDRERARAYARVSRERARTPVTRAAIRRCLLGRLSAASLVS